MLKGLLSWLASSANQIFLAVVGGIALAIAVGYLNLESEPAASSSTTVFTLPPNTGEVVFFQDVEVAFHHNRNGFLWFGDHRNDLRLSVLVRNQTDRVLEGCRFPVRARTGATEGWNLRDNMTGRRVYASDRSVTDAPDNRILAFDIEPGQFKEIINLLYDHDYVFTEFQLKVLCVGEESNWLSLGALSPPS